MEYQDSGGQGDREDSGDETDAEAQLTQRKPRNGVFVRGTGSTGTVSVGTGHDACGHRASFKLSPFSTLSVLPPPDRSHCHPLAAGPFRARGQLRPGAWSATGPRPSRHAWELPRTPQSFLFCSNRPGQVVLFAAKCPTNRKWLESNSFFFSPLQEKQSFLSNLPWCGAVPS